MEVSFEAVLDRLVSLLREAEPKLILLWVEIVPTGPFTVPVVQNGIDSLSLLFGDRLGILAHEGFTKSKQNLTKQNLHESYCNRCCTYF